MNEARMDGRRIAVLFFCFCSGCCSLIYQMVWIRLFSLTLGSTLLSVSFVTSMFFLGLALGSRLGGRLAEGGLPPLRLYGLLEVLISALAFLVPPAHDALDALRSPALAHAGAALLMLLASLPMGCVLPVLAPCFATRSGEGHGLAWMYGVNTLGACAGSLLAGALGIRFFGVALTHGVTAACNLALGAVVLAFARRPFAVEVPERAQEAGAPRMLYAAAFLSGLVFMGWEACALRWLGLFFRDTSLLYSGVTAAIIFASGAGDLAFGTLLRRRRALPLFASATAAAAVLAALGTTVMLRRYADVVRLDVTPGPQLFFLLLFAGLPAFFFSVSMPAFFASLSRRRLISRNTGRLLACNTLGSVAGALIFPAALFPRLGITVSLSLLGAFFAAYLAAACGLWMSRRGGICACAAGTAAAFLCVTCGVFSPDLARAVLEAKLREDLGPWASMARILDVREGLYGDSWAAELPGGERFLFSGRVIISRDRSASFRTEGFVPLLAAESAPQRVLSLCFGGGLSTVAAGMLPQAKRFDMVDISRENVELALKYFHDNARWQDDARVRFHFEDAFRFLRQSDERWDLILAEPTPPYFGYRGAVFYTVEFFRNAAAHLTPDGVFSMPLPCGQMTPEQARSVMKSFAAAFPFCRLWWNGVDPVMTGSLRPMTLSSRQWRTLDEVPGFFRELARVSGSAALQTRASAAAALLLVDEDFRAFARNGEEYVLDRPRLEFESSERQTFRSAVELFEHLSAAEAVRRNASPDFLPDAYWQREFSLRRTRLINTSVRMAGPF